MNGGYNNLCTCLPTSQYAWTYTSNRAKNKTGATIPTRSPVGLDCVATEKEMVKSGYGE